MKPMQPFDSLFGTLISGDRDRIVLYTHLAIGLYFQSHAIIYCNITWNKDSCEKGMIWVFCFRLKWLWSFQKGALKSIYVYWKIIWFCTH